MKNKKIGDKITQSIKDIDKALREDTSMSDDYLSGAKSIAGDIYLNSILFNYTLDSFKGTLEKLKDKKEDLIFHHDSNISPRDVVYAKGECYVIDKILKVVKEIEDNMEEYKNVMDYQVGGSHYTSLSIQPIEFIHKNNIGFCEGNIIKYITRHRDKNKNEDIEKAIHYAKLILKLEYGYSDEQIKEL